MNRRSTAWRLALWGLIWALPSNGQSPLFVTTSNFETGSIALLAAGSHQADVNLLTIHGDAVARYQRGKIYVINRFGQDNILVLDPQDPRSPEIQFSVGNGTNPYDIELISDSKAYVSRLASTDLLIVDPSSGQELGIIDLSAFADADGIPEMAEMVIVGTRLYVACQLLDRTTFTPAARGLIVVVDTETDLVVDMDPEIEGVQAWTLAAGNPLSMLALENMLFISETASFQDSLGGIEVIDLDTGVSRGLVIREGSLGGDVGAMDMVDSSRGYVVVSDANYANHVVPFDLATGTAGDALPGHSTGFTASIAVDGDRLIVADSGSFDGSIPPGLLIYDTQTNDLLAGPINTGLPPSSIAVIRDRKQATVIGIEESVVPSTFELGSAYPNPFNASVTIPYRVAVGSWVELAIFDVLGRRLDKLEAQYAVNSHNQIFWNGTDDQGLRVGSGTYIVRLRRGPHQTSAKVTLVK